jgi:cytochrome c-type biogenesis protein CcmH
VTSTRPGVALWIPWSVIAAVVVVALAVGSVGQSEPPTAADRVLALTQSIRCPQCAGQSVAESDVSVSREIRRDIANRVEQGQTDDQIRDYYAASFGPDALLTPSAEGVGGLVWVLPVVAVLAAAVGLAVAFRRWSASATAEATDDDRDLVARLLAGDAPAGVDAGAPDGAPDGAHEGGSGHGR